MTIWFTSDSHFGHAGIVTFTDKEGAYLRPFSTVEEMDEHMVEQWNAHVKPGDKVYHLGDFFFGDYTRLPKLGARLHGKKRLIVGNHDKLRRPELAQVFAKVETWRLFKDGGFMLSHIPIMPDQFESKAKVNVHGHIHGRPDPSPQHFNICVERHGYRPLSMDELIAEVQSR
jgi:calcineurin-like phosphoesterase family protein